jgi:crossover junction endonuclease MUS81
LFCFCSIKNEISKRKTVSDLSASIKDGRYRDQKFRLAQASLAGVVYLIEGPLLKPKNFNEKAAWSLLPVETLEAAITSTAYGSSGFLIQRCKDAAHTARWLLAYTEQLQEQLEKVEVRQKMLFGCDLASFGETNKKDANPTVSDVFAKQLLAISGISFKKAVAVIKQYPTMNALLRAYNECDGVIEQRAMLATLPLSSGRNLGPKASTAIAKALLR